jgi:hypothetical protein
VPGVTVRVVELGGRLELRNDSPAEVVVIGYDGEPYLRVGRTGTFENVRSPAVFLNRTSDPDLQVPAEYDATARPEWRQVSTAREVRWHDHRIHASRAMLARGPMQWQVDITVDGRPAAVEGESELVAPPPWWPWLFVVAGTALAIVLAARRHWRTTLIVALAALGAAGVVQVAGGWSHSAGTTAGRLSAIAMPVLALALVVFAIERLARRRESAVAWTMLAAVVVLVALGLADILDWFRSQLPSSLSANAVRAIVAIEIGGAIGAGVAAAQRLRIERPAAERETTQLAPDADRRVVT